MTTTMKCHYEILGVERDATADDLKKSYRKLALQWHPDKNRDRVEEVTQHFLLIQQAYDVLSDPQERAWYDKHREAILRGGHGRGDQYTDDSLDTFQYFNSSCFSSYNDSEKGFYTVYREVFQQLAEEDYVFMEDRDEFKMPGFGDSTSEYEEVVGPFYAYWESFYTAKSYVWEEKYDTREAPDRRMRRLMEAENKKLRDAARKERSEEVRALLGFVRKRDKRVQVYRKKLEERATEISRKNTERRDKQIKERLKLLENYEEVGWSAMSELEGDMQKLEANLAEQFGDRLDASGSDDVSGEEEEILDDLFCVACNKAFKSDRAFANHERSKKHKENVSLLRSEMEGEEVEISGEELAESRGDNSLRDEATTAEQPTDSRQKLSKKQKKRRKERAQQAEEECEEPEANNILSDERVQPSSVISEEGESVADNQPDQSTGAVSGVDTPCSGELPNGDASGEVMDDVGTDKQTLTGGLSMSKASEKQASDKQQAAAPPPTPMFCNVCHKEFPTRNKLFQHVKAEGHALHVSTEGRSQPDNKASSKKKGRKKGKNV